MITYKLLPGSIALSSAGIVVGLLLMSNWWGAGVCALIGLVWLASLARRWDGISSLLFFAQAVACGVGYLSGAPAFLALACLLLALCAWDLQRYARHLEEVKPPESARRFERRHLRRLFTILGAGLAISSAGLLIHFHLGFSITFILALLAIAGIYQAVTRIVKASRPEPTLEEQPPTEEMYSGNR
jgi:uncharacterized membrane protein